MPEGPEIRLAADRIASVLEGQVVEQATLALPRLRRFEKRLVGQTVSAVDTHGKAMLTRFDNGLTLYSHNQLYGRWYTTRRPELPDTTRQLRVALHTATHSALLYSASDIAVLTERQLTRHPFLQRLGPDILDASLTKEAICERLANASFRGRALGALYLDQGFLAGNGNYLRSEILWAARVNPTTRPRDLDDKALRRLAMETLRIARRSYRTRGVTVPDKLARRLRRQGKQYESYRFQVYGREGLPCHRCGADIERGSIGSRSIFTCPGCQPC
jgi:endonuclease-8